MNYLLRQARWVVLACAAATQGHAALQVVTTTEDLSAITRELGGDRVEVISLTPGTRDPHFAEAKPSMIRKVYRADLLLLVGAEMEIGWLPALLQAARNGSVQPGGEGYLDLSQAISLLGRMSGPMSRSMGDVHAAGNPHYWLDPRNGLLMARAIAARLSQLDTDNRDHYDANLVAFETKLEGKILQWRESLAALRNQPVVAYHRSFIYLAEFFGFTIVDEVEPKPGIAPSASHLNQLVQRIQAERVGLLIMEPYYERRSARYLSDQTGIVVAVLPQSVGALPEIRTYSGLFDAIVDALSSATAARTDQLHPQPAGF